jgi:hypothetical protein
MLLRFSVLVSWFPRPFGLLPLFVRAYVPSPAQTLARRFAHRFVMLSANAHVFENL